jgi:hypothetical protein
MAVGTLVRPRPQDAAGALLGLSLAAGALYLATRTQKKPRFRPVRDAGPQNMRHPPRGWDRLDQALDESFPCSDPLPHCVRSRYDR